MDLMTLAVAGIAALAIILIAFGIASSGSSGISDRLERYASGRGEGGKATAQSQGPITDLIPQVAGEAIVAVSRLGEHGVDLA